MQQLRVAAVDHGLAAEPRADAARRVLEVDQPLRAWQLEVERARGAVPEGAGADGECHTDVVAVVSVALEGWRAGPSTEASAGQPAALSAATLCEAFQTTAAERPDAVALRTPGDGVAVTWAEYAQRVPRIAAGLASLGVERGDTVALMLTNRPEFNIADTGALHLGATAFSVYNTSTPSRSSTCSATPANRVAITERAFLPVVPRGAAALSGAGAHRPDRRRRGRHHHARRARGDGGSRASTSTPRGARSSPTTSRR